MDVCAKKWVGEECQYYPPSVIFLYAIYIKIFYDRCSSSLAWVSTRLIEGSNGYKETLCRRVTRVNYIRLTGFPVTYAGSVLYAYLMNISPRVRSSPFVPFRCLRTIPITEVNACERNLPPLSAMKAREDNREKTLSPAVQQHTWKLRPPVEVCCISKLGAREFQSHTVERTCYGYTVKLTGLTTSWEDNAAFVRSCSQDPRAVYIAVHFGLTGMARDDSETRAGNSTKSCHSLTIDVIVFQSLVARIFLRFEKRARLRVQETNCGCTAETDLEGQSVGESEHTTCHLHNASCYA